MTGWLHVKEEAHTAVKKEATPPLRFEAGREGCSLEFSGYQEHSWQLSPLDVSKHLRVSQELSKVDVEHVTAGLQHDVVIVAVADSQDVGGHAAAGTRVDEVLHSLTGATAQISEGEGFPRDIVPASCLQHQSSYNFIYKKIPRIFTFT